MRNFIETVLRKNSRILADSALTFVALVVVGGVQFLQMVIFSRHLGAAALGTYLAGFAVFRICQSLAQMGLETAALRFVAQAKATDEWGVVARTMAIACGSALAAGLALGALMYVLGPFLPKQAMGVITPLALAIGPSAACVVAANAIRGLDRNVLSLVFSGMIAPLVSILVFLVVTPSTAADHAAQAFGLGQAAAFVTMALFLVVTAGKFPNRLGKLSTRGLFSVALPLSAINLTLLCNDVFSVLILSWFHSTEQVAYLGVCGRLMLLVGFILHAVNRTNEARFAALSKLEDRKEIRRVYIAATVISSVTALPAIIVIAIFGRYLLQLFGSEFEAAYPTLLVLLAGQFVNAALGPSGNLLIMDEGHRKAALVSAKSVVLFFVLALALSPPFAAVGAAVAVSVSLVYRKVALTVAALHRLRSPI